MPLGDVWAHRVDGVVYWRILGGESYEVPDDADLPDELARIVHPHEQSMRELAPTLGERPVCVYRAVVAPPRVKVPEPKIKSLPAPTIEGAPEWDPPDHVPEPLPLTVEKPDRPRAKKTSDEPSELVVEDGRWSIYHRASDGDVQIWYLYDSGKKGRMYLTTRGADAVYAVITKGATSGAMNGAFLRKRGEVYTLGYKRGRLFIRDLGELEHLARLLRAFCATVVSPCGESDTST